MDTALYASIAVSISATVVLTAWAVAWARVRRVELETKLKQDLLARGLSAEEMERWTKSPSGASPDLSGARPSQAALGLASAIASMEEGTDPEVIAFLLDAFLQRNGEPREAGEGPNKTVATDRADMSASPDM